MALAWRRQVAAGYKAFRFPGAGGGGGGYYGWGGLLHRLLPGTQFDFQAAAGPLWLNSCVLAAISWQAKVFPDAPNVVLKKDAKGQWEDVGDRPILDLLDNPNPYYDGTVLMATSLLSLITDGNAYWYKLRSGLGKLVQLIYIPHMQIEPMWPKDGSAFISGYQYRLDGKEMPPIPVEDMVHLRYGILDPFNARKGLSPLSGVFREVYSDNEAATFGAALLRNSGIPGVVISPKGEGARFTPDQAERLKTYWQNRYTADGRGLPHASNLPIDVQFVSWSPQEMALPNLRDVPEERITAALGIPAIVLGLGAGLEKATLNNAEAMERWAWRHNVLPMMRGIDRQLTRQLMPEVLGSNVGERLGRDLSEVAAMQEDLTDIYARQTAAVGGPWLSPNDARRRVSLMEWGPEFDVPYPPKSAGGPGSAGQPQEMLGAEGVGNGASA